MSRELSNASRKRRSAQNVLDYKRDTNENNHIIDDSRSENDDFVEKSDK